MAELMEVIQKRRSIRVYQEKEVSESDINRILEAVKWSPSWANSQCWEIILIRDAETKKKLQETLPKTNPAGKATGQAPVVLAVCGRLGSSGFYKGQTTTKFGDWFMFDLGIVTQNICLAAHDLGLATVIAGLLDHDKAKGVLGVPEGYELVTLIPLGYSGKDSSAPKRREIEKFTHWEKF